MLRLPDGSHLPLLARADQIYEIDLSCGSNVRQVFERLALQPWAQGPRQPLPLDGERNRDGSSSVGWMNDQYQACTFSNILRLQLTPDQHRINDIVAKHERPPVFSQTHAIRTLPLSKPQPPDFSSAAYQHAIRPPPLPPSGKEPNPDRKEFCTYWIRRGECDFIQQGCRYKHEMPDLAWLKQNGFPGGYPAWWKTKMRPSFGGAVRKAVVHSLGIRPAQKMTALPSESDTASEPEMKQMSMPNPRVAANMTHMQGEAEPMDIPQQHVRPVQMQPQSRRHRLIPHTDGSHDEVTLLDLSDSDSDSEPPLKPSAPITPLATKVPPNSPEQTAFRRGRFVPHNATPTPAPAATARPTAVQSHVRRAGPAKATAESAPKDEEAEHVQRLKVELSRARKALAQSRHAVPAPHHEARLAATTPEGKTAVPAPRAPKATRQVLHSTAKRAKFSPGMAAVAQGVPRQGVGAMADTGRVAENSGGAMGMGEQAGSTEGYKYLFTM